MGDSNKLIANQERLRKKQEIYSNPRLEKGESRLKTPTEREHNAGVGKLDAEKIQANTLIKGFGADDAPVTPKDMANQISRMLKGEEKNGSGKR